MDPPTYPFEETSFMNGPLLKNLTGAQKVGGQAGNVPIQVLVKTKDVP